MSRLWPHTLFAEDQPHPTAILTTHVLFRGFQTGAMLGPVVATAQRLYLSRRNPSKIMPFLPAVIRATGTSAIVGTGLLALALVGRMWGREDIEWRDRSWRLLENKGQVEVDTWSLIGTGLGPLGLLFTQGGRGVGWKMFVGSAGLGGTAGVIGYMIWRHGINKGKWPEDEETAVNT